MNHDALSGHRQLCRDTRTGLEGEVIARPGDLGRGAKGEYWLRPVDGVGRDWPVPTAFALMIYPEPAYWLRQSTAADKTVRLSAADAAMIAQRPDAVGDYRSPAGLVWRERDSDVPGGWVHFTITPVWETKATT